MDLKRDKQSADSFHEDRFSIPFFRQYLLIKKHSVIIIKSLLLLPSVIALVFCVIYPEHLLYYIGNGNIAEIGPVDPASAGGFEAILSLFLFPSIFVLPHLLSTYLLIKNIQLQNLQHLLKTHFLYYVFYLLTIFWLFTSRIFFYLELRRMFPDLQF